MTRNAATAVSEPMQRVLDRLDRVNEHGDYFTARCPAHDDRNPSLSVSEAENGDALLYCHAGCDYKEVLDVIGLKESDLFIKQEKTYKKKKTTVYKIRDRARRVVAEHHRVEEDSGKRYLWRLPYRDGWGLNGTPVNELPLYGVHDLKDTSDLVVLVEGEKARDALSSANCINALGTVCGASATPSAEVLEVLRDLRVCLWPDNDEEGRKHMERIAEQLQGIAAEVLWYEWPSAPEKGDAADHPLVATGDREIHEALLEELKSAPPFEPRETHKESRGLRGRVRLGERMVNGVEPPATLTERLYAGKVHAVNSEPGEGKTLYALHEAIEVMRQGLPVLYLDAENGPNLITERLEDLGAEPDQLDELLYYHPFPDITLEKDSLGDLETAVEEIQPGLTVFDSLPDFLALAGLNENDAGDVTRWMVKVVGLLRERGVAVLILDHLTKSAEGRGRYARGSGAKLAKVDVSYQLTQTIPFDRERVGEITLVLRKDREAYLPTRQKFAVGGTGKGLMFRPADGIVENTDSDGLTDNDRIALETLKTHYREEGAPFSKWLATAGMAKTSFRRAIKNLTEQGFIEKRGQRYYPKPLVEGPFRGHGP